MWYDLGLSNWVFEIDRTTGAQIAERVVQVGKNLPAARAMATQARAAAHTRMQQMIEALPK
jgi:DNA-binding transcriptional regulator YhcF (GntR family)